MHAQFAEGLHFSAFHLQTCSRHGNDEMHAYQVLSPCVQALGRLRSEEVILKRGNLLLFVDAGDKYDHAHPVIKVSWLYLF